ncbi:hypothetical protein ACFL6S_13905 [Candidatus Poribacteria bacterium]
MKKLSDEQKMKRYIFRIKALGILDLILAVTAYMTRFISMSFEKRYLFWSQYATRAFFFLIFLGAGSIAFGIVGIVRILLTRVSECQEQIKLLETQVSTLKGQESESS